MNKLLFFAFICLKVLDLVLATVICNFGFWTRLSQCRLHRPILSFHTRNYSCSIVLLSCPGTKSKQNDIILSPLYFRVRFGVSIVICRTCSLQLYWNCVLFWPLRPSEVPELAVYRFTFLEHTEFSEIKISHCPDATGGWQGNNVSLVLWNKRSRVEEEADEWLFSEGLFGRKVKTMQGFEAVFLSSLQKFWTENLP